MAAICRGLNVLNKVALLTPGVVPLSSTKEATLTDLGKTDRCQRRTNTTKREVPPKPLVKIAPKFLNVNVSRIVVQLSLSNPLKPDVKSRMQT